MHWQRWRSTGQPGHALPIKAQHGEPEAWIYENATHDGDNCLTWPFARRGNGWAKMNHRSPARLMCELVYGPPPAAKYQAAHSCGKGHLGCLNPKHLRWATVSENHLDKRAHGTMIRGEAVAVAKLTEINVRTIRQSGATDRVLANQFGVAPSVINRARNRKTWRHVQ